MASHVFNPHKKIKEEFVSNLNGSSILEIAALSALVPVLVILQQWGVFKLKWYQDGSAKIEMEKHGGTAVRLQDWRNFISDLVIDFLFVAVPAISCLTILADWIYIFTVCLVLLALLRIFQTQSWSLSWNLSKRESDTLVYWRKSISSYRFTMMLITCLTILAVDFKIFPRRYAKTETYGTGLMDLGVGSFVVANALVSRQARNISTMKHGDILKSISPLLFLGFARLILTKGVDYQAHVGEYGVHWNFFFTLAGVAILTSMANISPEYCGFFGCLILIAYQVALLCGLNDYLLSDQRGTNIVSLNKEGIFSLFGYWGLYLVSVNLGFHFFFLKNPLSTRILPVEGQPRILIEVWFFTGLFWALTIFLDQYVEKISRRMCNLAYTTFVLAQNFEVIGILMLSYLVPSRKRLILEEVLDQNLLATFLLANSLTGVINMLLDTVFASAFVAYSILLAYTTVLVSIIAIPKYLDVKLKFW